MRRAPPCPGAWCWGSTFKWPDLPAYVLGIGIGAWLEGRWRTRAGK